MTTETLPTAAYNLGRSAFLRGGRRCPFLPGRLSCRDWHEGWADAFAETYKAAFHGGASEQELGCLWDFRQRMIAAYAGDAL